MSAKYLACVAVEDGMSLRKAAKEYGVSPSTLYFQRILQKRNSSPLDLTQTESNIASVIDAVESNRLTVFGAAKLNIRINPCNILCTSFLVEFGLR